MKRKDIQKVVKTKYENGGGSTKLFRDLAEAVSLPTIKLGIKMINTTNSIALSSHPGFLRTVRTNVAIAKAKNHLNQKKRVSIRKFAKDMKNSRTSVERILQKDLGSLERGDRMLASDWTYQQGGARPYTHRLTQEWRAENFPDFIYKERWPPNSSDLCPLDHSLWNDLVQYMDWNRITTKPTLIKDLKRSKMEEAIFIK
ncbi:unnamed protein product [Rotaria socialis]|uniref:Uncharacterized protein n=1 Tax=Rotaria socialis TaxID=392032 RepID=A0A821TQF2_9BILA|nr:unnamed protein product [Rotaria socialis]CAF4512667.1 unnamed protein product [Rotaria socialis]CAF4800658.1 unnamed protein product [Rotaria socialis]CAF4874158.1 unnamed protein product [Rotaria socialis]